METLDLRFGFLDLPAAGRSVAWPWGKCLTSSSRWLPKLPLVGGRLPGTVLFRLPNEQARGFDPILISDVVFLRR